eukprot:CAMPEP_0184450244 /NCGR_PEP_ID=MMETSP0740-20130409/5628_1 /TAXON_ID=385413 /ORGANISM="Thalassiosira miniscula, Strain CCMP1093" /LENGTH=92 /DNA_ID=CAMNT_0026820485 /DNA_START=447 /DNA_END=726 /DNA_ORIENTATION=+
MYFSISTKEPGNFCLRESPPPHDARPTDDLFQEVGTILDEREETLERDEDDPPPGAEPGYRPRDEEEEEQPEDAVENVVVSHGVVECEILTL